MTVSIWDLSWYRRGWLNFDPMNIKVIKKLVSVTYV